MAFNRFNECGDSNPTLRLVGHLSQDQAQRDARIAPHGKEETSTLLIHQHLEEATQNNFQTYRTDELLREVQEVESSFGNSVLPPPSASSSNVSQNEDWLFNQVPPSLPRPSPFFSPSLPPPSVRPSLLPPKPFHQNENFPRAMYPSPPSVPVSAHEIPSQRPTVESIPSTPLLNPLEATLEEIRCTWEGVKDLLNDVKEASRFFGDSYMTENGDLESLMIGRGANKGNDGGAREEEAIFSAREFPNSKYLELLKKKQIQLSEEEAFDLNGGVEMETEELKVTKPLVDETAVRRPEFEEEEVGSNENMAVDFLKKFSELISNHEDVEKYTFKDPNPMLEVHDPFQEGLKRLEVGDLPLAVLCFEAAAQIDSKRPEVWQYLGTSQAANEQDLHAIAALKECLKLEPNNLTALMALAVSFTNEGYGHLAVIMLWRWLYHNPKYSDIVTTSPPEDFTNLPVFLDPSTHKMVKMMFIKAANRYPNTNLDPDVQSALGVLFNLIGDCSKASDCFKAALQVSPQDARLWNRLGATLANGQRSAEAIEAYYRSLSLTPGYVRARYNLGVSCINLGAHKEAMIHLLKALNQQASTKAKTGLVGQMSDSIWSTTKVVMSYLGRTDLLAAVDNKDLDALNQAFGPEAQDCTI